VWLGLDGNPMSDDGWDEGAKAIGMYLNGDGIAGKDVRGNAITDDHFLLYFNADGPADVTLPPDEYAAAWDVVIDTGGSADAQQDLAAGSTFRLETHSLVVLREHAEVEPQPDHSVAASLASLADVGSVDATPAADLRHSNDED
jgi:isoamylase